MSENQNLLPFQGEAYFYPDFFSKSKSDFYFNQLLDEIRWKQEPIKIFGKEVMQPRLTAWYGDEGKIYTYSGITMIPHEWTPALLEIRQKAEEISKVRFTSALLNLYRDGKDSMGWHRDNEKELGLNPVIGSVTFGASRCFQLRNYQDKKLIRSIDLSHGSFLLMQGETQHFWEHQLPKVKNTVDVRINITFRVIK
ncbi:Alkylated DNA repair dioxygenase AlkB [Pseudarcicella hirudinis]|uniref:Alkylated DNA repair dioxygenase AlkB n=1 Tax=Pseudarcicella hirudinis TaxID=1079859 RepID=A0A1I5QUQ4_9BACT|nr:alpha-ketoglutarate-dependent dioxygenase AlkB [Pseudarcicella hirudinis]SFP49761.1 Alkylated DNA repair dioxygenase AlkB [Pseudarcicella hirudinis]